MQDSIVIDNYFDIILNKNVKIDKISTCHPEYIEEIIKHLHPLIIYYINPYEHYIHSEEIGKIGLEKLNTLISEHPEIEFINILECSDNNSYNFNFNELYLFVYDINYYINSVNKLHIIVYNSDKITLNGNINELIIEDNSIDNINIELLNNINKILINKQNGEINLYINTPKLKLIFDNTTKVNIYLNNIDNNLYKLKSNNEYFLHVYHNDIRYIKYINNANFVDQSDIIISNITKYIELTSISTIKYLIFSDNAIKNISNEYRYIINHPNLFNGIMKDNYKKDNSNLHIVFEKYNEILNKLDNYPNIIICKNDYLNQEINLLNIENNIIEYEQDLNAEEIKIIDSIIYSKINISKHCKKLLIKNCTIYSKINIENAKTIIEIINCKNMINGDITNLNI